MAPSDTFWHRAVLCLVSLQMSVVGLVWSRSGNDALTLFQAKHWQHRLSRNDSVRDLPLYSADGTPYSLSRMRGEYVLVIAECTCDVEEVAGFVSQLRKENRVVVALQTPPEKIEGLRSKYFAGTEVYAVRIGDQQASVDKSTGSIAFGINAAGIVYYVRPMYTNVEREKPV